MSKPNNIHPDNNQQLEDSSNTNIASDDKQSTFSNFKKISRKIVDKIKTNKLLVTIFMTVVLVFSIVLWTILSASNVIIAGGSTSVAPILDQITQQYKMDKKVDVVYNALGSASALVGVKNKSYSFGFLSKDIEDGKETDPIDKLSAAALWKNYDVVRFVFAIDYIVLFYHLPDSCRLTNDSLNIDKPLGKNKPGSELIQEIYNNKITWQEAFGDQLSCQPGSSNSFYAITREAGSGTRDFFESKVITTKNYSYSAIVPSNGAMFQAINETPGSIGYISFSYLNQIADSSSLGVKSVFQVSGQLPFDKEEYNKNKQFEFNKTYSLTRPFTGIVNLKHSRINETLAFLRWMIDPKPYDEYLKDKEKNKLTIHDAAYWYLKEGAQPLSSTDKFFIEYNNNTERLRQEWNDDSYESLWDIVKDRNK